MRLSQWMNLGKARKRVELRAVHKSHNAWFCAFCILDQYDIGAYTSYWVDGRRCVMLHCDLVGPISGPHCIQLVCLLVPRRTTATAIIPCHHVLTRDMAESGVTTWLCIEPAYQRRLTSPVACRARQSA
ncbi:hypothetical protein AFLA_011209 [Aspergillus flavus NRRL3357]|nr:hypothetical protein AFLA_011209 [Aspergillus flavus NRRL3357]